MDTLLLQTQGDEPDSSISVVSWWEVALNKYNLAHTFKCCVCVHVRVCVCMCACACVCVEGRRQPSGINSFLLPVHPEEQTQVVGHQAFLPTEPSCWPQFDTFYIV